MERLLRIAHAIDGAIDLLGRALAWLTLAMVLIGGFNALSRYAGRFTGVTLSSNAYIELQWYLFSLLFLLGASYALRHNVHVRVDVLYGRLGEKGKAAIDVAGTVLFLVPFCVLLAWISLPSVISSWQVLESSPDPGGLPRYPIKTVFPVAIVLVLVQGLSELLKRVAVLRGKRPTGAESDLEASSRSGLA
ncbi:MAG: TRAP transporter small permease subunit [Candidatus Schekmanbacteria bacterium]|nr:TRAP transporter small permease subunit [Candidatus Schekmanbacteria bacterium]